MTSVRASVSPDDQPVDLTARLPALLPPRDLESVVPRQQQAGGMPDLVMLRRVLLMVVAAQLADAVTFVAAIQAGVPLVVEANPVARAIYPVTGSGGVIDLKLVGVAALVGLLALGGRWRPGRSGGRRFVLAGGAIIGLAGLVGAVANVSAALSLG